MTLPILQFAAAAAVIIVAGTFLSKFADQIAELTGLGRLLIGSVLLAGATSLPELTVDIAAVRAGLPDLAFGDLLGSSLFNLAILAALDLLSRSRGRMFSRQAAGHALSGNVSAALTAAATMCLLAQSILGSGELLGISYGLWFILVIYLMGIRLIYFDQQVANIQTAAQEMMAPHPEAPPSLFRAVAGFAAAAIVIVIVGPFLADAAGDIAELSGLGTTFVGSTLVAFSTSLPELVASIAALRMGAVDLAIGNIFGSNAFNMLLLLPLDLVHSGPILAVVSPHHAVTGVAAMLATMTIVIGQLYHVERRRWLIEPDATLVLLVIVGSLWLIYQLG